MIRLYFILLIFILLLSCTSKKELGSEQRPLHFALVPGQDTAVLQENGQVLADWILQETGLHVKVVVPTSFVAVVEAMGSKRVDVAIMNTFGYILAHKKYGAKAGLIGTNGDLAQYWGQIITSSKSIQSLEDINQRKFAFVDPASTSGYLLPSKLFKEKKIKPREVVFAGKHDSVVMMVYQGRVDAGATYHTPAEGGRPMDARKLVKDQFPDVYEKVRILTLTGPIPSDPVVFRAELDPKVQETLKKALKSFSSTEKGREALMNLYHLTGFKEATDLDYEPVRQMLLEMGKEVQDLVK